MKEVKELLEKIKDMEYYNGVYSILANMKFDIYNDTLTRYPDFKKAILKFVKDVTLDFNKNTLHEITEIKEELTELLKILVIDRDKVTVKYFRDHIYEYDIKDLTSNVESIQSMTVDPEISLDDILEIIKDKKYNANSAVSLLSSYDYFTKFPNYHNYKNLKNYL